MNEFFRTMLGRTFFEGTLPNMVKQLSRLNDNLEKMNALHEASFKSALERDAIEDARFTKMVDDAV